MEQSDHDLLLSLVAHVEAMKDDVTEVKHAVLGNGSPGLKTTVVSLTTKMNSILAVGGLALGATFWVAISHLWH